MLWGLQSSVTSRFWSGRVAAWLPSGAMSPRVQNPGVHALGLHVFPLSGSTCGGTGVGDGQIWSAPPTAGLSVARPSAARNGSRPVLPRILLSLFCCVSATAFIHPPFPYSREPIGPACALRRDIVFPDRLPGLVPRPPRNQGA